MGDAGEDRTRRERNSIAEEILPESAVNLSVAMLVWLFGVLIFLPLASEVDPSGLLLLCDLIILLTFSTFLFRGSRGLKEMLDIASRVLAYKWIKMRGVKESRTKCVERKVKATLYSATIVIVYLLYSPLLVGIHPSVNGIAIILAMLGVLSILLRELTGE